MTKADYVRHAPNDAGDHTCHWLGCTAKVKPAVWECSKHWYTLPLALQRRIWRTFRPGQEISKTPSADYIAAAHEVKVWIAAYQARKATERLL